MASSALTGLIGLLVFQGIHVTTGLSWGWVKAFDVPGIAHPILAPANAVAYSVGQIFGDADGINVITRNIATGLSLILAVWLVMRIGRTTRLDRIVRAAGWALLAVAWLGPAVYPWYLTWGIAIIGAVGAGPLRKPLMVVVVFASFAILPGGYGTMDQYGDWKRTVIAFAATGFMLWGVRYSLRQAGVHPVYEAKRLGRLPASFVSSRLLRSAKVS